MIASAEWKGGTLFDGTSQSGHTVRFDAGADHAAGPSMMEMVLTALCGCTSVDVVSILQKKREPIQGLIVTATAEQAPEAPRVFTKIHLTYRIRGKVAPKAAEDAVALSKNKYCSVSKMLEKAASIDYSIAYDE
ncbi:MAG TPA: OsmC family protein [Acidobacteriaceae bacterium]|nr:OsmC family protein [Acidobacteriaceae bacterium]